MASLAQWQSTGLVNQGSWVQSSQEAGRSFVCFLFLIFSQRSRLSQFNVRWKTFFTEKNYSGSALSDWFRLDNEWKDAIHSCFLYVDVYVESPWGVMIASSLQFLAWYWRLIWIVCPVEDVVYNTEFVNNGRSKQQNANRKIS